jgi:hypothetical protein
MRQLRLILAAALATVAAPGARAASNVNDLVQHAVMTDTNSVKAACAELLEAARAREGECERHLVQWQGLARQWQREQEHQQAENAQQRARLLAMGDALLAINERVARTHEFTAEPAKPYGGWQAAEWHATERVRFLRILTEVSDDLRSLTRKLEAMELAETNRLGTADAIAGTEAHGPGH